MTKVTDITSKDLTIVDEILQGLTAEEKYISSKFFYDEYGSKLFEEICKLDEYYLTRAEMSILQDSLDQIKSRISKKTLVIELGSGSIVKIKFLLDNLKNIVAYCPIDISRDFLIDQVSLLKHYYRDLIVTPIILDYAQEFFIPNLNFDFDEIIVFYSGSSIGNFSPGFAREFLQNIFTIIKNKYPHKTLKLLLGVDLIKDKVILENAYNDKREVTKNFNLNSLSHINKLTSANFSLENWQHQAFFNQEENRIEMHLISLQNQIVNIGDKCIRFSKDETIRTEYSYKYSFEIIEKLFKGFLFVNDYWTDADEQYGVFLLSN